MVFFVVGRISLERDQVVGRVYSRTGAMEFKDDSLARLDAAILRQDQT